MSVSSIGGAAAGNLKDGQLNNPGTQNYSAIAFNPDTASSGIQLNPNGNVVERQNANSFARDVWLKYGISDNYEVRYTYVSGSADFGVAVGVWWSLTAARTTGINRSVIGTKTAEVLVEIRNINNNAEAISFTANLSATQDIV